MILFIFIFILAVFIIAPVFMFIAGRQVKNDMKKGISRDSLKNRIDYSKDHRL